jgi:hypothetical protein
MSASKGHTGSGQPVHFIAIDILRIRNGRITDNWHLETTSPSFSRSELWRVNDKRTDRAVDIHLRLSAGGGEVNLADKGELAKRR